MRILGRIKGIFRRKKEEPLPPLPPVEMPRPEFTTETATIDNVKAKMDLVMTQLDSLRTQYEAINQRIIVMERMLKELYDMAKSS